MLILLLLHSALARPLHPTPQYSTDRLPPTFPSLPSTLFRNFGANAGSKESSSHKPVSCPKDDIDQPPFLIRSKRFVTNVEKWDKKRLKWRFRDPYNLFKRDGDFQVVRETISHALKMWSTATQGSLEFRDVSEEENTTRTDMDLFFARWDHGDHEPFDGRGGIVAHSGYPKEGRVHFDASELWTINGSRGIDLRYVILHELGHALGLRHSRHRAAIMHPIYQSPHKRLALSPDDVKGIVFLYPPPPVRPAL